MYIVHDNEASRMSSQNAKELTSSPAPGQRLAELAPVRYSCFHLKVYLWCWPHRWMFDPVSCRGGTSLSFILYHVVILRTTYLKLYLPTPNCSLCLLALKTSDAFRHVCRASIWIVSNSRNHSCGRLHWVAPSARCTFSILHFFNIKT
jgi:hypothetical protein